MTIKDICHMALPHLSRFSVQQTGIRQRREDLKFESLGVKQSFLFLFFFFFKSLKPSTKTISIRHLMFSHGDPVLDFQLMNFRHPIILPNTCVVLSFFVGSL